MSSLFRLLFVGNVIMLVLLAISYPFTEPGSGSRAISHLSLAFILLSLAGLSIVLYSGWDPFDELADSYEFEDDYGADDAGEGDAGEDG